MARIKAQQQRRPGTRRPLRKTPMDGMLIDDAHPHLWLTEDNQDVSFRDLLRSVRCRRSSLSEISIYNILSRFSKSQIVRLYNTVAELPHLENFSVWASQALCLPVLTTFLQKASKLEQAAFSNIEIHSEEDLKNFSNAILQHPKLKRLSLDNLQIMVDGLTIDPLLQAVALNPRMESLRLSSDDDDEGTQEEVNMISDSRSLESLCHSPSLKELFFWGLHLTDENVICLADALKSASDSRIQKLGLRKCGPNLTNKGYQALVEMLQRNFQIKAIHLDTASMDRNIQWTIAFYLDLNASGTRQTLLGNLNATREDWIEGLASHSNDLNALFYLLEECGSVLFVS